jgi:hypothetical protein
VNLRASLRWAQVSPIMMMVTGAAPGSAVIEAARPDAALIDKGDLGVATYAMLFVIVALLIDRWMDRRALAKLADAIDRRDESEAKRSTALLVQLSVLASVVGRELPKGGE